MNEFDILKKQYEKNRILKLNEINEQYEKKKKELEEKYKIDMMISQENCEKYKNELKRLDNLIKKEKEDSENKIKLINEETEKI